MYSRLPPRKPLRGPSPSKRTQTKKKDRPEWNEYLTDASNYQLNQDQLLQKKIQMLTKIPTDNVVSQRPPFPKATTTAQAPREGATAPPRRKPPVPRANVSPPSSSGPSKSVLPRVNFDDELRAYHQTNAGGAPSSSDDVQKQRLQKEIDRMDAMLASLELQADQLSGGDDDDNNQEDGHEHDLTATTHNDSTVAMERGMGSTHSPPSRPSTAVDVNMLDLVHQLHAEVMEERRIREAQQDAMLLMQKTLDDMHQSHSSLRDDFKRAVKHIVKLKTAVTTLSHTVETLQAAAASPRSSPSHIMAASEHRRNDGGQPTEGTSLKEHPVLPQHTAQPSSTRDRTFDPSARTAALDVMKQPSRQGEQGIARHPLVPIIDVDATHTHNTDANNYHSAHGNMQPSQAMPRYHSRRTIATPQRQPMEAFLVHDHGTNVDDPRVL
ncbi:Aste57867_13667 [Aphanomyces stellatus]|uniref:Aste57867_13667 protein n=1 Tax=Aphanomyces stellatus TaxID=120398 RepID=A0A485KZ28_9STRA|nr:hypothetical protein As57867_013617 [Aphanomyces stellatus]VFT90501.1 Aste57867_13667 [Aphanomyces stellatus]